jgi:hypothetical protein
MTGQLAEPKAPANPPKPSSPNRHCAAVPMIATATTDITVDTSRSAFAAPNR